MRLDVYLFNNGFYESREKAKIAINKGLVSVDGNIITKPSFDVVEPKILILEQLLKYVSFGGLKLERAIEAFNLDFSSKIVLDIGSSTGGFTDCALQNGAKEVVCVDVGSNQLHESLRNNPQVILFENTNIINFNTNEAFDYLVMDVSFVSIKKIIPYLIKFMNDNTKLICLFKPQFEVGHIHLKNGVIKDKKIHKEVVKDLISFINSLGLYVNDLTYSTQKGKSGNIEYLALVSKSSIVNNYDIDLIINESHKL